MKVYIDKKNIHSILAMENKYFREDIFKIFRRQVDTIFNFQKPELFANDELRAFASIYTEGFRRPKSPRFNDVPFPDRPIKPDFHNNLNQEQISSMYLLNEETDQSRQKNSICFTGPDHEYELFNSLVFKKEDYNFHKSIIIGGPEFQKWDDLEKYNLPFTDMILIDRYIFSDKDLVLPNYSKIVEVLHRDKNTRTNIIVFTSARTDRRNGKKDCELSFDEIRNITNKAVLNSSRIKPNITVVKLHALEHDRTILFNYHRIHSGDSFNYFDSASRKITSGREISFSSHLDEENETIDKKVFEDLQKIISELIKNNNLTSIEGDKVSNFLKFK